MSSGTASAGGGGGGGGGAANTGGGGGGGGSSSSSLYVGGVRRISDQQSTFTRQATILRKNLLEWDRMLRTPRGEDWPTMLGRLNAAHNQTATLDKSIDDVLEHFVYVPLQSTANAQDIPFFLSTRLETQADAATAEDEADEDPILTKGDPVLQLARFEAAASKLATEYEENMVRF